MDSLLRSGKSLVAIEVKSTRQFTESTLRRIRAIEGLPCVRRRLLVYLGARKLKSADGIEILPLEAFLRLLETGSLL